jgi:hypothetical protein
MVGHRVLFKEEFCMRIVWIGRGDGAALEKLLIDQCQEQYGRYYPRIKNDVEHSRGRCLNKATGGGGYEHHKTVFVYLLHKDPAKLPRLRDPRNAMPYLL